VSSRNNVKPKRIRQRVNRDKPGLSALKYHQLDLQNPILFANNQSWTTLSNKVLLSIWGEINHHKNHGTDMPSETKPSKIVNSTPEEIKS
jgi:hypothetical protein